MYSFPGVFRLLSDGWCMAGAVLGHCLFMLPACLAMSGSWCCLSSARFVHAFRLLSNDCMMAGAVLVHSWLVLCAYSVMPHGWCCLSAQLVRAFRLLGDDRRLVLP